MSESGMNMTPGSMADGGMNSTDYMSSMTMHMSFFWGKDVVILFSRWPEGKLGMYILALFFVFLLAAGVEVLSISPTIKPSTSPVVAGLTQASIYALRMVLAYSVMLSVMSYNLGIFIVAVAGHTVGYFLIKVRAHAKAGRTENLAPKV